MNVSARYNELDMHFYQCYMCSNGEVFEDMLHLIGTNIWTEAEQLLVDLLQQAFILTSTLSLFHTFALSHFRSFTLSLFHTFALSNFRSVKLSHFHSLTPSKVRTIDSSIITRFIPLKRNNPFLSEFDLCNLS